MLTDAGRALLPHARAALAAADAGREAVDAIRGGLRGVVRLGIMQSQSPPGSRVSVPRLLRDFRDRHPGVELRVGHGSRRLGRDGGSRSPRARSISRSWRCAARDAPAASS